MLWSFKLLFFKNLHVSIYDTMNYFRDASVKHNNMELLHIHKCNTQIRNPMLTSPRGSQTSVLRSDLLLFKRKNYSRSKMKSGFVLVLCCMAALKELAAFRTTSMHFSVKQCKATFSHICFTKACLRSWNGLMAFHCLDSLLAEHLFKRCEKATL